MRPWLYTGPLFDAEPGAGGGSDTYAVDPGMEFEHGHEPPKPDKPEPTQLEKDFAQLKRDNEALAGRLTKAEDDSRFWARRANAQPQPQTVVVEREQPAPRTEQPAEKPQQLMDDMSRDGLNALFKRGVITADQLIEELEKRDKAIDQRIDAKIDSRTQDVVFGQRLQQEFPEIMEDSKRKERGEEPKSELWHRSAAIYKDMVSDDPSLEGSNATLLAACKLAKKELAAEAKGKRAEPAGDDADEPLPHRPSRRERIAAQTPDRGRARGEENGDGPSLSKTDQEVMKQLGVSQEEFVQNGGGRRGRN